MLRRTTTLAVLLLLVGPARAGAPLVVDDFEGGLKPGWEAREFQGRTEYTVVEDGEGRVLKAVSRNAASGLVYPIEFDPNERPILSWRWKVENLIEKSDPTRKEGDDYAARVYVIFPHWFPPKTRSLTYIWATAFPQGSRTPNPFFQNAVMIAAESGPEKVGQWVTERRDLIEDYRRAFGETPLRAGAIAVMTDTDQTAESAVAYYDDIRLEAR